MEVVSPTPGGIHIIIWIQDFIIESDASPGNQFDLDIQRASNRSFYLVISFGSHHPKIFHAVYQTFILRTHLYERFSLPIVRDPRAVSAIAQCVSRSRVRPDDSSVFPRVFQPPPYARNHVAPRGISQAVVSLLPFSVQVSSFPRR